jgi:hypothetical protein
MSPDIGDGLGVRRPVTQSGSSARLLTDGSDRRRHRLIGAIEIARPNRASMLWEWVLPPRGMPQAHHVDLVPFLSVG